MSHKNSYEYLNSLRPWDGKADFDLQTISTLMKALGNPQDRIKSIHVAGTNGKGSVCAFLSSIFRACGFRVGQLASPHLSHVTERCLIDGHPVAHDSFAESILQVQTAAMSLDRAPTYFEAVTAASFVECKKENVDWLVVEVGLGGRLDATNVLKHPEVCVITSIDFDHTDILGNTLSQIAREKAGILKTGVPLVVGLVGEEAARAIREKASELKCENYFSGVDFTINSESRCYQSGEITFHLPEKLARRASKYQWPRYQFENAAVAIRVAEIVGLKGKSMTQNVIQGLLSASWPGRAEQIVWKSKFGKRKVLFDVAHNLHGIRALFSFLYSLVESAGADPKPKKLLFAISILSRKNWRSMLQELKAFQTKCQTPSEIVFAASSDNSAVDPRLLQNEIEGSVILPNDDTLESYLLEKSDEGTLIVITGSVAFVGHIRESLIMSNV